MPRKDREGRLAYQREWYAKHRKRVIAKVNKRKWTLYGGTCKNCGGPTMGNTKGETAEYCSSAGCVSAQRKALWEQGELFGHKDRPDRDIARFRNKVQGADSKRIRGKPAVMTIDELVELHQRRKPTS